MPRLMSFSLTTAQSWEVLVSDDGEDWAVWDNLEGTYFSAPSEEDEDLHPIIYMDRKDAERAAEAGQALDQVLRCEACGTESLAWRSMASGRCPGCDSQNSMRGTSRWEPVDA